MQQLLLLPLHSTPPTPPSSEPKDSDTELLLSQLAQTTDGAVIHPKHIVSNHSRREKEREGGRDSPANGSGGGSRDGPGSSGGGLLAGLAVPDSDGGTLDRVLGFCLIASASVEEGERASVG